jgi:predicted enzyme involved in methoxymalonyl-ACP biosynthesis
VRLVVVIEKFDSDNIRRQLGAKKLSLVLDLDHTLLHAVRVDDVIGEIAQSGMPVSRLLPFISVC